MVSFSISTHTSIPMFVILGQHATQMMYGRQARGGNVPSKYPTGNYPAAFE